MNVCGFVFTGIDLEAKTLNISEVQLLEVSYPNNPILLTGLKALSIAEIELRTRRYSNDDNLLRCDYRLIKAEDTDMLDVLKDFLHPFPEKHQRFALSAWFDDHGNEESPDSIVLRITLTEGTITDNEKKYGEWQYKVDFVNKTVK